MWISEIAIRRPVFAIMMVGALIALGFISLGRIGYDLFPRVEFPYVSVQTTLEGAAPETVETEVTDVIEEEVNTISAIESLRSTSAEGYSQINVEFSLDANIDVKAQEVRDKVSIALADLPDDVKSPVVGKVDPDAAPIMSVMIAGDLPIRALTRFADKIVKERLQRIDGVGSVKLLGGRDREIRIWLDADKLRSYNITADDVIRAIRNEHAELPGGRLDTPGRTEEFAVKTKGEVDTVQEFGDIVVAFRQGAPTRVRDVARVEDGVEDERTYAELNGQTGVSLEIRRQSGENTLEVARAVKASLGDIRAIAPPGTEIVVARDISNFIEGSVNDVTSDMQLGVSLVVLVTFAFLLNFRATAIVAISMPSAIIATFFAFYLAGFTLNMLTMMALSVAIGLLVDDAIVVLESIHRAIDEGNPPLKAASVGVRRVGPAVFAGSISVIAVFVPIAFMEGVVGRFFFQYGLAIVFSVAVSFLISMTLTPALCARFLRPHSESSRVMKRLHGAHDALGRFYGVLLRFALRFRFIVLLVAAATIVLGVMVARQLPVEFTSKADRSEFLAYVELPFGTGIEETKRVGSRVAAALQRVHHVQDVFYTIGGGAQERVNEIDFYVKITFKKEREQDHVAIMADARRAMQAAAPEAKSVAVTLVPWISGGGFQNFDAQYAIRGSDLDTLESLADQIMEKMRNSGILVDVQSSYETGKPEIQVDIDRQRAADLGVSIRTLATTVRALVGGLDVATYEEFGERYDVRVRLEPEQRDDLAKLEIIQLRANDGRAVDLANVARVDVASGPAQINRMDRARAIDLFANTPPGVPLSDAVIAIERFVQEVGLPEGYSGSAEGQAKRMRESSEAIGFAFILALTALYMILASQFNSFVQPAIIMLTAPLSFMGAFVMLYIGAQPLTMFAQIGLIALMGLVMKNGILLVDYANHLRENGASAREAMQEAGPIRLRPVLMTALSTIFGMIPVAMSDNQGSEFRNALGFMIIGGLTSSTFLTLLVVPVAYTLLDDAGRLLRRLFEWATRLFRRQPREVRTPAE